MLSFFLACVGTLSLPFEPTHIHEFLWAHLTSTTGSTSGHPDGRRQERPQVLVGAWATKGQKESVRAPRKPVGPPQKQKTEPEHAQIALLARAEVAIWAQFGRVFLFLGEISPASSSRASEIEKKRAAGAENWAPGEARETGGPAGAPILALRARFFSISRELELARRNLAQILASRELAHAKFVLVAALANEL